jgi:LysM repeat protein
MPTHTIVAGDTFWRLSQVYGCTLDEILAANPGVVPEQLHIGQIVRIPYQS